MTDNEIIKAFENAKSVVDDNDIETLQFFNEALDLIYRQKAEIERLKKELDEINRIEEENELQALEENKENAKMFLQSIDRAKSEAIKEFAERLKSRLRFYYQYQGMLEKEFCLIHIDKAVKEMTEG